jgi:hypothetical protein
MRAARALALVCAAAGPLLCVAGAASARAEAPAAGKLRGNNFHANCRFSHTSNDDPER